MKTLRVLFVMALMLASALAYSGPGETDKVTSTADEGKSIPISGVSGLDVTIACELNIRQGDEESLRIETSRDIFSKLDVEVRDSILYIDSDDRRRDFGDRDVDVYLTVKTLNKIDIGGAVKIRTSGTLETPKLELSVSGAADIKMSIDTERLLADLSGAVKANFEGKARYVVMDMSGASKVDAEDLVTEALYLDFSGFGKANIYAEKVLKVDMSGMGVVKYGGNPGKVDANSSGLGIIKER
ncbi:MAG: head GIN domain-containing protein [Bacteroidota bacterium]